MPFHKDFQSALKDDGKVRLALSKTSSVDLRSLSVGTGEEAHA